jgi:signal transduction histidine kinase/ligand-binding sensor domain-containing protein
VRFLAQLLALPALLALAGSPAAAAADLQYRVWTTEEGLPQGSVRAIAQTPDGYIWIATLDGLVRFDGVRMTVFSKSDVPEMASNRCVSLLVDRRGVLWIGTEDGGVLQKTGSQFRAFGRESGLPSQNVGRLTEDAQGRIGIATDAGAAVLDGDRWRLSAEAESLLAPPRFPQRLTTPAIAAEKKRHQDRIVWISPAPERLWVLEGGYLHRYDHGSWLTFNNPVPALALSAPNALFEDREGSLWIGSEEGLVHATATAVRALVPSGPVAQRNVYTLAADSSGRVWVGTQSSPLLWEDGAMRPLDGESWWPSGWMSAVEPDADGSILTGSPSGIYRIWPGHRFEKLRDAASPRDFLRDRRGTLWVATEGGLLRQSATGWESMALSSTDVRVLLQTRDGVVWAGTYGGLARLDGSSIRIFTTADGLSSDRVRALHEDETGALWIGTYDGGLNRFADGKFVSVRKRDGLYDDGVFAIVDGGDDRYYMSSNRGIFSVAKRDLDAFTSGSARRVNHRAWRSVDGMPSSECNGGRQPSGFRAADGTLWFPTQRGIAVIDPRAAPENALPPLVVIEEIATEQRTIRPGEPVVLAPGERRLEVRYTGNTFLRPEGARFRYQLAGFDDDWVDAGSRRLAQWSHIRPGHYTLTILAANSDGVWSPEGAALAIHVQPYWWETTWFRAVALALSAGLLGTLYQRRVSSFKRRRAEHEAFARRLLESQEAERKRIATELHDGIGQTLVLIRNRALLGLRDGTSDALARQVTEISTLAADSIDEVRKVSYGLRPYQIDRLGLTRALEALMEQTADASAIAIATAIGEVDGLLAPDAEINVYRIVQEAVSNLVRHAQARTAHVEVGVSERELAIRVDDDGVGFDPDAVANSRRGGLGLSGIAERARLLGGRVAVRSASGRGTSIVVAIPLPSHARTA